MELVMSIKQVEPPQAYEILQQNRDAIYVDVRTEEEFAQGHPAGAVNLPVVFLKAGAAPAPNPSFLEVAQKVLAQDKKLVVGCMAGGRSQRACEILEQAGYSDLTNVRGGFGGARDATGEIVVVGWRDAGLPVSRELGDSSYRSLCEKADVR
jgi:rhodanese-related sulfurtransferase